MDDAKINSKTSGYLEKRGKLHIISTSWKKYWFILDGRLLSYYNSKEEYETLSPCKGCYTLASPCTVKPATAIPYVFQIGSRSTTITLRAQDTVDQTRWIQAVLSAVTQSGKSNASKLTYFRYSQEEENNQVTSEYENPDTCNGENSVESTDKKSENRNLLDRLQKMGAQSYILDSEMLNKHHTKPHNETVVDKENVSPQLDVERYTLQAPSRSDVVTPGFSDECQTSNRKSNIYETLSNESSDSISLKSDCYRNKPSQNEHICDNNNVYETVDEANHNQLSNNDPTNCPNSDYIVENVKYYSFDGTPHDVHPDLEIENEVNRKCKQVSNIYDKIPNEATHPTTDNDEITLRIPFCQGSNQASNIYERVSNESNNSILQESNCCKDTPSLKDHFCEDINLYETVDEVNHDETVTGINDDSIQQDLLIENDYYDTFKHIPRTNSEEITQEHHQHNTIDKLGADVIIDNDEYCTVDDSIGQDLVIENDYYDTFKYIPEANSVSSIGKLCTDEIIDNVEYCSLDEFIGLDHVCNKRLNNSDDDLYSSVVDAIDNENVYACPFDLTNKNEKVQPDENVFKSAEEDICSERCLSWPEASMVMRSAAIRDTTKRTKSEEGDKYKHEHQKKGGGFMKKLWIRKPNHNVEIDPDETRDPVMAKAKLSTFLDDNKTIEMLSQLQNILEMKKTSVMMLAKKSPQYSRQNSREQ